mmetsp:Transcript_9552/g.58194  ORF Transcript_9552/g.58194 Transcript_9552/m.58194 type:complete len:103 (-) Transcript_9552:258-566(-)
MAVTLFSSTTCLMASSTLNWSPSSRKVVNSSSRSNSASCASTPAMATLCFCPPDSVSTGAPKKSSMRTFLSACRAAAFICVLSMSLFPSPNATSAATVGRNT